MFSRKSILSHLLLNQSRTGSYDINSNNTTEANPPNVHTTDNNNKTITNCNDYHINSNNFEQQDGVTLCSLGAGTTFGASVMPGKTHSVSVVTADDCTLLRVRRADFQEIFRHGDELMLSGADSSAAFCALQGGSLASHNNNNKYALPTSSGARRNSQQSILRMQSSANQQSSNTSYSPTSCNPNTYTYISSNVGSQHQPVAATLRSPLVSVLSPTKSAAVAAAAASVSEEPIGSGLEIGEHPSASPSGCSTSPELELLACQLIKVGYILRALIHKQRPEMLKIRRIQPHQLLHQNRHHQRRPLVSRGSSSQLLQPTSANQTPQPTPSRASAGRKVASYVASSFLRSTNAASKQAKAAAAAAAAAVAASLQQAQHNVNAAMLTNNNMDEKEAFGIRGSRPSSGSPATEPAPMRRCMVGRDMVDWLLGLGQELALGTGSAGCGPNSRLQALSMWQVLLERGIVEAISNDGRGVCSGSSLQNGAGKQATAQCCQFQFCDDQIAYYRFWLDNDDKDQGEEERECLAASKGDVTCYRSNSTLTSWLLPGVMRGEQVVDDELRTNEVIVATTGIEEESMKWALRLLGRLAPDACFRLILAKRPNERSHEEVDIVFEELQHLKALSHLTNSVKKQLAGCVSSEHHAKQNTVVFNQGDVGHSWYIILSGSVNVVIVGKGVVCSLHEGDDFGKLALVNDAPRAATIVTNEPNCYFLRVDKHDFNTILRDVEANTVRLKEHGKEVLILQKVAAPSAAPPLEQGGVSAPEAVAAAAANVGGQQEHLDLSHRESSELQQQFHQVSSSSQGKQDSQQQSQHLQERQQNSQQQQQQQQHQQQQQSLLSSSTNALKYMVMAGTGEKMLEHLLETRIEGHTQISPLLTGKSNILQHDQISSYINCHQGDNFLEDFILTHKIFMPTSNLCAELLKQYQCQLPVAHTNSAAAAAASRSRQPISGPVANQAATGAAEGGASGLLDDDYLVAKKRRVVKFVRCWMLITREHFFQQQQIQSFLTTIHQKIKQDAVRFSSLQPEMKAVARILELHLEEELGSRHRGVQRWIDDIYGNILPIRRHSGVWIIPHPCDSVQPGNHTKELERNELAHSELEASELEQQTALNSLHLRRFEIKPSSLQAEDEVVFRVYCADHSFASIKARVDERAAEIKLLAARKLKLKDKELILVHVKSNGERTIYNDLEFISTTLSVNGRIFVCPLDHIDAISPLPEQDPFQETYLPVSAPPSSSTLTHAAQSASALQASSTQQVASTSQQQLDIHLSAQSNSSTLPSHSSSNSGSNQQQANSSDQLVSSHLLTCTPTNCADIKTQMALSVSKLEEFSSRDIAYCLTQLAWSLLKNMHEFELIYLVFGRHHFKQQITANLNVFMRHFNEIQYWVVTQICLSSSLSKRVQILRKFIKIAAHCKELQNLNAFFAIIMGLSNMAVARLTQTWERLPNKLKRTFSQFEALIDPSRNHRRYRIFIAKMEPPIIPFMPLFLKDMTFAHEGNKTYLENGLINFEKMQMVAQTLRTIRHCKSRPMKLDSSACKFKGSIRSIELFFRDLKIIDNQRTLTQMSHQLEHRKT